MMMNADPTFVRALQDYDPQLDCQWNDHAKRWAVGRWIRKVQHEGEIERGVSIGMVRDHFHPIFHVETEDREYRRPGRDTIESLVYMDLWQGKGMTANRRRILAEQEAQSDAIEQERITLRDDSIDEAVSSMDSGCGLRKWWT